MLRQVIQVQFEKHLRNSCRYSRAQTGLVVLQNNLEKKITLEMIKFVNCSFIQMFCSNVLLFYFCVVQEVLSCLCVLYYARMSLIDIWMFICKVHQIELIPK